MPSTPSAAPAALHLRADGISFSFPDRRVLTDVDLVVPAGRPTGLLGENGSGKTTLLHILAGRRTPDAGSIDAPGPLGLLRQDLPVEPGTTLGGVLEDALSRSRRLERELTAAGEALAEQSSPQAAQQFDELLAAATLADVWNAERRAEIVLAALRLDDLDADARIGRISGGQRERLSLAHLLIARPTTWLLDEPTNHLDEDGARFLTETIAAHPGPVLIASHDRAFLDEATQAQIDLDPAAQGLAEEPGGASTFTGDFSDYLVARFDARDRWEQRFRREQEELKRLRAAVVDAAQVGHEGRAPRTEARAAKKFYADRNARTVSRRLTAARDRLETLEREQIRKPPAELHFTNLPAAPRGGDGTVLLAASRVAIPGRLRPVSVSLSAGERLLITGANGSGKSTLLDVLTGRLTPATGTVSRPASLRIGHLAQDDEAAPGCTVRDQLGAQAGIGAQQGSSAQEGSSPELFGLVHPRDLDRPLTQLSRGQLRRVMLAAILADPPELLVLDEPTNHLALITATRLEAALEDWNGTVLIASHDRWLRRRWQGEVLDLDAAHRPEPPDPGEESTFVHEASPEAAQRAQWRA